MAKKIKRGFGRMIVGLIKVLGLSSILAACGGTEDEPPMYGMYPEYGMPANIFVLEGTVTGENAAPVKGIKVGILDPYDHVDDANFSDYYFVSANTDENGNYKLEWTTYNVKEFKLALEDVDGAENGSYLDKTVNVQFTDAHRTGVTQNGPYEDVNYKMQNNNVSLESSESVK